jgi:hypothetical protein
MTEVTLYRKDGPTRIWVGASIAADGRLDVAGQDIGDAPEQFFGRDDYEYIVSVQAADVGRVREALRSELSEAGRPADDGATVLELLVALLGGRADAHRRFRAICEEAGIDAPLWTWP